MTLEEANCKLDKIEELIAAANKFNREKEREILDAWCKEAHLTEPIGYYNQYHKLTIYTNRPGLLIGCKGKLINKYRAKFREVFRPDAEIEFVEIRTGFANYRG